MRKYLVCFSVIFALSLAILPSQSAMADTICSWPLNPGTTWETWSLDHHFMVEFVGSPNMVPLVENGSAWIVYNNEYTGRWETMQLLPWDINIWGVQTWWVALHPTTFFDSSRWLILWYNGANGILCPLA